METCLKHTSLYRDSSTLCLETNNRFQFVNNDSRMLWAFGYTIADLLSVVVKGLARPLKSAVPGKS